MSRAKLLRLMRHHNGATVIFVAIAIVMLLSLAALAVDLGYLYTVRASLQNAADSGALAGAQRLYNATGTAVTDDLAMEAATTYVANNPSEQVPANAESIKIGHWRFASREFKEIPGPPYPAPPDLWDVDSTTLDDDFSFVNAVQVITRRKQDAGGQVPENFFAKVFGAIRSEVKATAVAYIGFAGKLEPLTLDQPIAMCEDKITDSITKEYTCGVGRMLSDKVQTARWTNLSQEGGGGFCTAKDNVVNGLICGSGNVGTLVLGEPLGTTNGTQGNNVTAIDTCWRASAHKGLDGRPDEPWPITLPVINGPCDAGDCKNFDLVGAVTVNVVWIRDKNDPNFTDVPTTMYNPSPPATHTPPEPHTWTCSITPSNKAQGIQCWNEFAAEFNLLDAGNSLVDEEDYALKSIYFLPDCRPHPPMGVSGGKNFGILAKIPVLVK